MGRVNRHVEAQFAERVLLQQFAAQPIAVTILTSPKRQDLRVRDFDPLLLTGLDGEDAGLEDVSAGPFQQARVAALAENLLVNLPCPLLLDDVGGDLLAADPHGEARDRGVLGQGEVEDALGAGFRVIDERFLDHGPGDLVADVDLDPMVPDGQRHVATVDLGQERAERLVRRGSLEAG